MSTTFSIYPQPIVESCLFVSVTLPCLSFISSTTPENTLRLRWTSASSAAMGKIISGGAGAAAAPAETKALILRLQWPQTVVDAAMLRCVTLKVSETMTRLARKLLGRPRRLARTHPWSQFAQ